MNLRQASAAASPRAGTLRFSDTRLAILSWVGLIAIVALTVAFPQHPMSYSASGVSIGWLVVLAVGGSFGLWLAHQRSRWAAPWQMVVVTGALGIANMTGTDETFIWMLFPMSAVISLMFFSRLMAQLHMLALMGTLIISSVLASNGGALIPACVIALFSALLLFVIERMQLRESHLVAEVAARAAQHDAFTAISWSLTSLEPSVDGLRSILASACPPDVSLALMLLRDNQLVPEAAVGPDAAAMLRWQYPLRDASTSIAALALRERRTQMAALGGQDAALLLNGALPTTPLPVRAATAVPIMRQGGGPHRRVAGDHVAGTGDGRRSAGHLARRRESIRGRARKRAAL